MKLFHSRPVVAVIALTFFLGLSLNLAAQQMEPKPAKPAESAKQYPPAQPQRPEQAQGKAMGGGITLHAELLDKDKNARDKAATVQVHVTGIHLIDPAMAGQAAMKPEHSTATPHHTEQNKPAGDPTKPDPTRPETKRPEPQRPEMTPQDKHQGVQGGMGQMQGHLHYQVDDGPIIATTMTKLSFHGLSTGPHKIVVMLAGNDHAPLGPRRR